MSLFSEMDAVAVEVRDVVHGEDGTYYPQAGGSVAVRMVVVNLTQTVIQTSEGEATLWSGQAVMLTSASPISSVTIEEDQVVLRGKRFAIVSDAPTAVGTRVWGLAFTEPLFHAKENYRPRLS